MKQAGEPEYGFSDHSDRVQMPALPEAERAPGALPRGQEQAPAAACHDEAVNRGIALIVVGVVLAAVSIGGAGLAPAVRWATGATGMVCLFGGWDQLSR